MHVIKWNNPFLHTNIIAKWMLIISNNQPNLNFIMRFSHKCIGKFKKKASDIKGMFRTGTLPRDIPNFIAIIKEGEIRMLETVASCRMDRVRYDRFCFNLFKSL